MMAGSQWELKGHSLYVLHNITLYNILIAQLFKYLLY